MLQKLKQGCKPTTLLMVGGFAISLMSMMVGISTVDRIMTMLNQYESEVPIALSMQNTGLSLSVSIYVFSLANCFAITNYWIITKRREMAIRKAFGWRGLDLVLFIGKDLLKIIAVSLVAAGLLTVVLSKKVSSYFAVKITPFFVLGTVALLLVTLVLSMVVPIARIIKIRPAEVIE